MKKRRATEPHNLFCFFSSFFLLLLLFVASPLFFFGEEFVWCRRALAISRPPRTRVRDVFDLPAPFSSATRGRDACARGAKRRIIFFLFFIRFFFFFFLLNLISFAQFFPCLSTRIPFTERSHVVPCSDLQRLRRARVAGKGEKALAAS